MQNQSHYDPTRKTVGAMYNDAQAHGDKTPVTAGDLTNELMSSLVEDLNETIQSRPFGEDNFYITVHEKKDRQMPRAILRRLVTTKYRPYPEDDTVVFFVNPVTNHIDFCWCLPHWSDMDNMLANEELFDREMIADIKAWKRIALERFGFVKIGLGDQWAQNPHFKDKAMTQQIRQHGIIVPSSFMAS